MTKCYLKAIITDYNGQGEYWASLDGEKSFLIDEDAIIFPNETCVSDIDPEELTGILGQLIDEVDLPPDLLEQIQDIYQRALFFVR